MAKSDFNNSVFVVKVYEHTTPLIVEIFLATEQGISDAHQYCEIMEELVKEDTMWLCLWLCLSHKLTIK